MSSLGFSVGTCSPPSEQRKYRFLVNNSLNKAEAINLRNKQKASYDPELSLVQLSSCGRREAILGFGFSIGLLDNVSALAETTSCEFSVSPSGLAFCDKVVGYGPEAVKGQLIKAHYVGKLENGKVFDSSYNRGKPLTFRIGVGEVIRGWDQGILGSDGIPPMLTGGKRTLKIPPELAYGDRGAGCKGGSCLIPPASVLLFDIEFIGKA
ncbi:FKBP-type peptidyl-prolyl cis-trans isomerase domain [Arabidopsis thaliana x Arabidopsis arenosa]|uniref:peptidylprolyl isomerase n=2 Tax=Arabidopsis TaxID=3701 RepID=A0A8T1XUV3_ARASU|nr:FKBP-type peptidyl-prolyl cis-trans isomerase domain [Arabidopsis thaliana x Arabidopsis arenosa]KAG7536277.1 FKBP-type peptidyl-prolyl cis-trans isomerase domain [Arabidopsis suecica]